MNNSWKIKLILFCFLNLSAYSYSAYSPSEKKCEPLFLPSADGIFPEFHDQTTRPSDILRIYESGTITREHFKVPRSEIPEDIISVYTNILGDDEIRREFSTINGPITVREAFNIKPYYNGSMRVQTRFIYENYNGIRASISLSDKKRSVELKLFDDKRDKQYSFIETTLELPKDINGFIAGFKLNLLASHLTLQVIDDYIGPARGKELVYSTKVDLEEENKLKFEQISVRNLSLQELIDFVVEYRPY